MASAVPGGFDGSMHGDAVPWVGLGGGGGGDGAAGDECARGRACVRGTHWGRRACQCTRGGPVAYGASGTICSLWRQRGQRVGEAVFVKRARKSS